MSFLNRFEEFHRSAMESAGLDDFGSSDYHEPMRRFLSDLDVYCDFNQFGHDSVAETIIGTLVSRLYTQESLKKFPDARDTPIEKPLFIVGMPRTGTTVLHRLMTYDPSFQWFPFWLASSPMPRPPRDDWASYPQYQHALQYLENHTAANAEIQSLHPIFADLPDESSWLVAHTFWLSTFAYTADLPEYNDWFLNCDNRWTVQYFRRCLAMIANGDTRRWLIKDPAHVFQIEAILEEFPDACIVQTHREPSDAMASGSYIAWLLRSAGQPGFSKEIAGANTLKVVGSGLDQMEKVRQRHDPAQFYDVHMLEIQANPLGTIERVYEHFDLPITDEARKAWDYQIQNNRNQSHGSNTKITPAEFGISRENAAEAVGSYYSRYQNLCEERKLNG